MRKVTDTKVRCPSLNGAEILGEATMVGTRRQEEAASKYLGSCSHPTDWSVVVRGQRIQEL